MFLLAELWNLQVVSGGKSTGVEVGKVPWEGKSFRCWAPVLSTHFPSPHDLQPLLLLVRGHIAQLLGRSH